MNPRSGEPIRSVAQSRDYILRTLQDRSSGTVLSFDVCVSTNSEERDIEKLGGLAAFYGYRMIMGERRDGFVVLVFVRKS